MIVLGVVLALLGWLIGTGLLYKLGVILIVIGLILWLLGAVGRPIGGRNWY